METETVIRSLLPPPDKDGVYNRPFRLNPFDEQIAQLFGPDRSAEEGSSFVTTNPTLGTAIATTTSITAFTVASPVLVAYNGAGQGGANITLDYLRMILSQVPTSATNWHWAGIHDPGSFRYTSGGSELTPVPRLTGGRKSSMRLFFGAIVAPAASGNVKIVHRSAGRSAIPVTVDEWLFKFGSTSHEGPSTLGGTVALRMPIPSGPVVLAPGDSYLLYGWGASNAAAPSWEFELGHTER